MCNNTLITCYYKHFLLILYIKHSAVIYHHINVLCSYFPFTCLQRRDILSCSGIPFFTHNSQWVTEARNSTWQTSPVWEINIVVSSFRYTVTSKPSCDNSLSQLNALRTLWKKRRNICPRGRLQMPHSEITRSMTTTSFNDFVRSDSPTVDEEQLQNPFPRFLADLKKDTQRNNHNQTAFNQIWNSIFLIHFNQPSQRKHQGL